MNKELEEFILSVIKEFTPIMFLERNSINVKYDKEVNYLECGLHYPYLDTSIIYNNKVVKSFLKNELKDLRYQIVHELCHIITDPLYTKATYRYLGKNELEDEREHLTDLISKIVLNINHYATTNNK